MTSRMKRGTLFWGFFFFFLVGELRSTPLIASCSTELAKPAAVGRSGPGWMKHICHRMKAVSLGK